MENIQLSQIILVLGALAFVVSVITQATKGIGIFDRIPTKLQVLILSLIICVVSLFAYASYKNIVVTWYEVFATVIGAFIVALISSDGWDSVKEIWDKSRDNSAK